MKKIVSAILFLFNIYSISAQHIRPYVGFATYLDTDFSNSVYLGIGTGIELRFNSYFKPEIEISGTIGSIEGITTKDVNGIIVEEYTRSVSSLNFSICPKITLDDDREINSYFVILPRYSISNIEAHGNLTIINQNSDLNVSNRKIGKEWRQSLGIGIGYNFDLSDQNAESICIILYYQGVEMGNTLNQINEYKGRFTTKNTFGLGFNYYFRLKKKNKQIY